MPNKTPEQDLRPVRWLVGILILAVGFTAGTMFGMVLYAYLRHQ